MARPEIDIIQDFIKKFKEQKDVLEIVIPMLIPVDNDDEKKLEVFLDMMDELYDDLTSATSISQINEILDVDKLVDEWPELSSNIDSMATQKVKQLFSGI